MTIRFIHAADIHLGYKQYGSEQRHDDITRAFEHLVDDALARQVHFVLLAGDFFHKRIVEPYTLFQGAHLLNRLREAGIPVLAIEGNHERPLYQDKLSWLQYLAHSGLMMLLNPRYDKTRMVLEPYDAGTCEGAYVDLPSGARVVGVKYYGASTGRVIQDLAAALADLPGPRPAYTVLMLHAGLQGILDNYSATLSRAQLEPLRAHVDYVALGHIHKPFAQDDWLFNPGSLETQSVTEVEWRDRGYLVVEAGSSTGARHQVQRVQGKRRPFQMLSFAVDTHHTPESLYEALARYLKSETTPDRVAQKPVAVLRLVGMLAFERSDLDLSHVREMVEGALQPLVCLLQDMTTTNDFEITSGETLTRADLERHVLVELLERDVRHREHSDAWAQMVQRVKQLALGSRSPQEIVAELRTFRELACGEPAGSTEGAPC
ncbi:MAG: metallophosphoesterase family protein [Anaerolineae bacterium]